MPPSPAVPLDIASFQGKKGLEWTRALAVEFWAPCLAGFEDVERDPDHPEQIGWFIDNGPVSDEQLYKLGGVALELVRRYVVSEVVHAGLYNDQKRRFDMRVIMASGYYDRPFEKARLLQFKSGSRVSLPPDWERLQPLGGSKGGWEFPPESDDTDTNECEADLLRAYDEALSDEKWEEIQKTAAEQATAYGEFARETYLENIAQLPQEHGVEMLDPGVAEVTANALAKEIATPLVLGGPLISKISERWATADFRGRQVMEEATIYQRIALIDAKMVTLMTERETLLEERVRRQELLAEEKKRRRLLEEGYKINMSIRRDSAALEAEVEKSKRESVYVHPSPARQTTVDALRKKGAAVQRSLETRRIQQALSPVGSGVAPDAPNSPEHDASLVPYEEVPTSPVGDHPEHGEGDGEGTSGGFQS